MAKPTQLGRVLIVDDDQSIRTSLAEALLDAGIDARAAGSAEEALPLLGTFAPELMLTDVRMPGMNGIELLRAARARGCDVDVVLMTAYDDMSTVVAAMREGAIDFLVKPLDLDALLATMHRALEDRATRAKRGTTTDASVDNTLVGRHPAMIEIYKRIGQAASTRATVLIRGESGTGKEVIARAIHAHSAHAAEPFVPVNCAALPSNLLESELFGHTRGAFTGAINARRGCFAVAGAGTVFLDEIGDTTAEFQSKLLRVLQNREYQPVGAERSERTEARVIAATHRDLERMVADGRFREDLYYRLRIVEVTVPPLRERVADIATLAQHFVARSCVALDIPRATLSKDALRALNEHTWPGNVRELENCLTRAVVLAAGKVIRPEHLSLGGSATEEPKHFVPLAEHERDYIAQVLKATRGSKSRAAQILGVSRPRLSRLMEKYGLE